MREYVQLENSQYPLLKTWHVINDNDDTTLCEILVPFFACGGLAQVKKVWKSRYWPAPICRKCRKMDV